MSKQRKLRNKLSFDEDEQEGDHPPPPPPPSSKKESSKPKKSSLLSFGDDDEAALAPAKAEKEKTKVSKFHRANISSVPAVDAAAPLRPAAGAKWAANSEHSCSAAAHSRAPLYDVCAGDCVCNNKVHSTTTSFVEMFASSGAFVEAPLQLSGVAGVAATLGFLVAAVAAAPPSGCCT